MQEFIYGSLLFNETNIKKYHKKSAEFNENSALSDLTG